VNSLKWVDYSRWVLWFTGGCYFVLGCAVGPVMWWAYSDRSTDTKLAFKIAVCSGISSVVVCSGLAILNILIASGLKKRRRWAWLGAIIIGGLYAPSICLPFGVVLLYGMLQKDVRQAFSA